MCNAGVENKGSVCEILPPKLYVYIYPVLEMFFLCWYVLCGA